MVAAVYLVARRFGRLSSVGKCSLQLWNVCFPSDGKFSFPYGCTVLVRHKLLLNTGVGEEKVYAFASLLPAFRGGNSGSRLCTILSTFARHYSPMSIVQATDYHVPGMLEECLEGMNLQPTGHYVDVTFGGGGHSRAILDHLSGGGHLYSFDQDPDAAARAAEAANFTFVAANFRHLSRFMDYYDELGQVDALLADLGVSSHHFDEAALADILYRYGELKQSRQIARRIVQARSTAPLQTVGDLIAVVRPLVRPDQEKKQLSCIFQALRIEVNGELAALEELLESSKRVLRPGGRLVVMTYHSLEDRIVKNFLRQGDDSADARIYGSSASAWRLVTRKPIVPSVEEVARNPRARSAKLRIAELL